MVTMMTAVAALTAFSVAVGVTRRARDPQSLLHVLDHPGTRSLHTSPTPRTGGMAILAGMVAGVIVYGFVHGLPRFMLWLVPIAIAIATLSFVDDRRGLSVRYRLVAHMIAAGLVVLGGLTVRVVPLPGLGLSIPAWLAVIATVLYVIWMTNLYNFMDGMDGFASGMAVFGFATFALLGWLNGNEAFFTINTIIAAASAGFLIFNFPPAKIFMGDTGSSTLGFLAAGIALWADHDGIISLWVSAIVFSPFIVDATVTLLRRMLRGERVWEAHKTHYYQRLVQLGWGHRKTVLVEYALMAACAASAVWVTNKPPAMQYTVILGWICGYAILIVLVGWFEKQRTQQ